MSEHAADYDADALDKIDRAFHETFTGDFGGYDWRDDETVQQFARTVGAILNRRSRVTPPDKT